VERELHPPTFSFNRENIMSEPVHMNAGAVKANPNVSPYLIELPPNPVGIRMVPHMFASGPVDQGKDDKGNSIGEEAPLVKTGKLEVRFDGSSLPTKDTKGKPVDWEKVAYNAAHQAAYYRQVHDNLTARAEEYERKYSGVSIKYENQTRDMDRLRPLINEAYRLKDWWGYRFLPKAFKKLVAPVWP
jgi:hypothetical protein